MSSRRQMQSAEPDSIMPLEDAGSGTYGRFQDTGPDVAADLHVGAGLANLTKRPVRLPGDREPCVPTGVQR